MPALYSLGRLRPQYADLFDKMEITNSKRAAAKSQALKIIANKDRYKTVETLTGIPWFVVGCIHFRECNIDKITGAPSFNEYLGNGESLHRITKLVPKGRGPWSSFDEGAVDALVTVENLNDIPYDGSEGCAYAFEKINGFGYRNPSRNIPSPYLWGGTNIQERGKWMEEIKDGKYRKWYDPNQMDQQIGAMATLRMLMDLDPDVVFPDRTRPISDTKPSVADNIPVNADTLAVQSPRADDMESQVKPLIKSKTILSTVGNYLMGLGLSIKAFFAELHDPYVLGFVVFVTGILSVFAFMAIKGRWDVQNVLKHLSLDDKA